MAKILIKKDGKTVESFSHPAFQSYTQDEKERIYNLKNKEGCEIFCSCQQENVKMTIAKNNNTHFFKNLSGSGEKHQDTCPLHSLFSGGRDLTKGWTQLGDVKIVNLSPSAFRKRKRRKAGEESKESEEERVYSERRGVGENTVTLLGLTARLNITAWNRYYNKNKAIPSEIRDAIKMAYGFARLIQIKDVTLQDYWYEKQKLRSLKSKELLYVYKPLVTASLGPSGESYQLTLADLYKNNEAHTIFECSAHLFDEERAAIRQKEIEKNNGKFAVIVAGFVQKNARNEPEFTSITLLPITHLGLWHESSYERDVYELLASQGRLFKKGFEPLDDYGGFIPDIIFLDTDGPAYGEVFGVRNVRSYEARKEEKLEIAKANKDKFHFWHWDLVSTESPPPFPPASSPK